MRAGGLLAIGLVFVALPTVAAAQSAAVSVDQLGSSRASTSGATTTDQIGATGPRPIAAAAPSDRSVAAQGPGRTLSEGASQAPSQLNQEAPRAHADRQLTEDAPRADAPASGTDRVQGKNTTTAVLAGDDRCDPRRQGERPRTCARVIETRGSEFPAPEINPLTPEQRLLVSQRELNERPRDLGDAVRRLGNGDVDLNNVDIIAASQGMGTASPPEDDETPTTEPSATDAIVSAIISGIGAQQP